MRYDPDQIPSQLFSFVGTAAAHPVRRRIVELDHPEAIIFDASAEALRSGQSMQQLRGAEDFVERYARSAHESAFIICPRGGGTSSFRLFEAMMLGRVPVIVSDQWVAPRGPDWGAFSVRVPEARVADIPALLGARRIDAAQMGELARAAWLQWFSPAASFHRSVEWCLELAGDAGARSGARGYAPYLQMLRPYHAARWVRKRIRR